MGNEDDVARLKRERDSWEKESSLNEELLDMAGVLLVDVEVWANGSTTFPPSMLADIRRFLGPQRCSTCKSGVSCSVHPEEVYVEPAEPPCRECKAIGYHKMDCTHARRGA